MLSVGLALGSVLSLFLLEPRQPSDPEQGGEAEESCCVWVTEIASFGRSRTVKFEEEKNGSLGLILYESCFLACQTATKNPQTQHKPSKQRVFKSWGFHTASKLQFSGWRLSQLPGCVHRVNAFRGSGSLSS